MSTLFAKDFSKFNDISKKNEIQWFKENKNKEKESKLEGKS